MVCVCKLRHFQSNLQAVNVKKFCITSIARAARWRAILILINVLRTLPYHIDLTGVHGWKPCSWIAGDTARCLRKRKIDSERVCQDTL